MLCWVFINYIMIDEKKVEKKVSSLLVVIKLRVVGK